MSMLDEREKTHGDFMDTSAVSQQLKRYIASWNRDLPDYQQESIDLICTKIARILSGDPTNPDHWIDISGYAQLVVRILENSEMKP